MKTAHGLKQEKGSVGVEYAAAAAVLITAALAVIPFFLSQLTQRDAAVESASEYTYPVSLTCQTDPDPDDECP